MNPVEIITDGPIGDLNTFFGYRVPRPPPEDTSTGAGHLCWGQVGNLPSPELAPADGFKTVNCHETHQELSRTTAKIRIENPDEPEDWVEVDRPKTMTLNKAETVAKPKENVSTEVPEGIGDFAPSTIELTSFKPLGTDNVKKCQYTVSYNYPTPASV